MNNKEAPNEMHILKERAKELNCLYQVDEILNNQRFSLAEMFEAIVQAIPSGWQFPEICEARIVYENNNYQTSKFYPSPYSEKSPIKVDGKVVGYLEVAYTEQVPQTEEGCFLEKERKLINTIADRIGQTIFHRQMKHVLWEWNESQRFSYLTPNSTGKEWAVIVNLLLRTDPDMLLYICRKMINYLYWSGIKEVDKILIDFSEESKSALANGEVNFPSAKLPIGNLETISERTFGIAAKQLSDAEISLRIKKWMQEHKSYHLIKTINRLDVTISEIIEAVVRYTDTVGRNNLLDHPTERWLVVALIQRFLSDSIDFVSVAKQNLHIGDFNEIVDRLIFSESSHGRIGGKSAGLFLAHKILEKESENSSALKSIRIPKTWYITTDELTGFLHYNNLEEFNVQKYKDLAEIRMDYPNLMQIMKNGKLPPGMVKSLAMALDDFGDSPIIVRSSSLLEDQFGGAAFSGKYKSLFLANQGSKKERLDALMDAIKEVYASVYSPDSIHYRLERGLLDFQEEMGIMVQEVVGKQIGDYYLPLYAGVGLSYNEFRWSARIEREDGIVRLVMGLGTRAVDRLGDDFPVLFSPGQPNLRVNTVPEEISYYSPRKADVINLKNNTFETVDILPLLREHGQDIIGIERVVSVKTEDYISPVSTFVTDFGKDHLIVTFDGLINDKSFIEKVEAILTTLQEKLGTPVDIEFASDGKDFYLLQCRPQSFGGINAPAPIPKDVPEKDQVFSARRHISNGLINDITHIVFVDPDGYNSLPALDDLIKVGRAVGRLNSLLPRRRFILIGPGRWGSRGDIKLGVPVGYSDISNTAALIEVARKKANYVPEPSFGTHFFQDLVESNIKYIPLYPDDPGTVFNEIILLGTSNILADILPEFSYLDKVIRVIDVANSFDGKALHINMNAELGEALAYLAYNAPR